MGKHSVPGSRWPHHPRQTAGAGQAVGPEDRELVEPDRDLAGHISGEERAAREAVHTDRVPEDDILRAAADSGERLAVEQSRTDIDQADPADFADR
jgi:hypothetical protein